MTDYDVIVVGAGPAGSTAARFAALGGARVLLLDRRDEPGVPAASGELLPSIEVLRRAFPNAPGLDELFELPPGCVSERLEGADIFPPSLRPRRVAFEGFSIRRPVLDRHLSALAEGAGAELRTAERVRGVERGLVLTDEGEVRARVVIGADGPLSVVRRCLGVPPPVLHPCLQASVAGDFGCRAGFFYGSRFPGGRGWLVPKRGGANIGIEVSPGRSLGRLLERFIHDTGAGGGMRAEVWGLFPVSGPVPGTAAPGVLLAGDAAGQTLPFHGWGLPSAMVCGRAAGEAAADFVGGRGRLEDYDERWRREAGGAIRASLRARARLELLCSTDLSIEAAVLLGRRFFSRALSFERA